ncbi:MAG TPA: hypothetical protein VFP26_14805 [Gemmatimonadaceae bacterium]|jgi:hypothetical protein|nr:hypothetical protein [Gemmatimonadaceae bacterium]
MKPKKKSLREKLFGFLGKRKATPAAASHQPSAAVVNETGTPSPKRRAPRIIGITEQRLRARNQGSWMMSAKAWKKFMGADTTPAKE